MDFKGSAFNGVEGQRPSPFLTRPRILVDLSHAAAGHVGIAQDIRLVFRMLCDVAAPSGLLMPTGRHDLPRLGSDADPAATAAVLHWMARNWANAPLRRGLRVPFEVRAQLRSAFALAPLAAGQEDAVWRILFAATLAPSDRAVVLARPYLATDLAVARIIDRTMLGKRTIGAPFAARLGAQRLAAQGFDAVLFCMPRPVALPAGVTPIMRFHDAVPVTDTDTVMSWQTGVAHQALVRACPAGTIFACDSPQALDALLVLDPTRAGLASVVPCAVAPPLAPVEALAALQTGAVITRHLSFRALGGEAGAAAPAGWEAPGDAPYVMAVSTVEPRKNYPALLSAFERVRARVNPALRLVIVGGLGWRDEGVLAAMRAGVASGAILHLAGVPSDELQLLMARSRCLVSASFNEGFGLPPLEALQAGCPVLLSDLAVYRWIFGEAALYFDPYDVEALAGQMARLAGMAPEAGLREGLAHHRSAVLARFRPGVVAGAWEALLERARGVAGTKQPAIKNRV